VYIKKSYKSGANILLAVQEQGKDRGIKPIYISTICLQNKRGRCVNTIAAKTLKGDYLAAILPRALSSIGNSISGKNRFKFDAPEFVSSMAIAINERSEAV
jgi:hypothetical protein